MKKLRFKKNLSKVLCFSILFSLMTNVSPFNSISKAVDQNTLVSNNTTSNLSVVKYYPIDLKSEAMVPNTLITLEFNSAIVEGKNFNNITLKSSSGYNISIDKKIVSLEENTDKKFLQIAPQNNLSFSDNFTLTVPLDSIQSTSNETLKEDYVVNFKTNSEFHRLGGDTRFETSVKISQHGWSTGASAVVLASGMDFPDALSAAPLARKYVAPILLTDPKSLNESVLNEIKRLNPHNIYIVGGHAAVSKEIENLLTSLNFKCKRLSGNDRYETAVAIAKEIGNTGEIVVASGISFPDALSIAPFAASNGTPILLSGPTKLPTCAEKYIKDTSVKESLIIGGPGAISLNIEKLLPSATRIAGKNRYETNFEIISTLEANCSYAFFATGKNFPDALSGSAIACYFNSPIILVDDNMDKNVLNLLKSNKEIMLIKYFLGGKNLLSPTLINKLLDFNIGNI